MRRITDTMNSLRPGLRDSLKPLVVTLVLIGVLCLVPAAALSQVSLGGQRVGTASGTFLKLPLSARGSALGGAFIALVDDATSVGWNPAGLAALYEKDLSVSHIQWFADIDYTFASYAHPWPWFSGTVGVFFGSLSTIMDETTEYMPYGTGRKFYFDDWVAGVALSRRLTDKLLVGANIKYVREELGTDVGGPVANSWLLDVGTKYYVGLSTVRMAMLLSNFGPEMKPSGTFTGVVDGTRISQSYEGFAPPTVFKFGVAFDPVQSGLHRVTTALEMNHYADNEETVRAGVEYEIAKTAALRGGYDLNSDEMSLSFGAGVKARFAGVSGSFDYAYSKTEHLGNVNIFTLNLFF
ncbi:MAG: PorV/PorQ family protein [Candidatus Eisenbacteria bacterium]